MESAQLLQQRPIRFPGAEVEGGKGLLVRERDAHAVDGRGQDAKTKVGRKAGELRGADKLVQHVPVALLQIADLRVFSRKLFQIPMSR